MRTFYTDQFVLPLPEHHRFPMEKYRRLRERLVAAGVVPLAALEVPPAAGDTALSRVHTRDYLLRVVRGALDRSAIRRIGFPWSPALVERSRRSVGATIAACRAALEDGVSVSLAGGTHHAFAEAGEGFCVFNDTAVAIRAMQHEGRARRVLVVDCDVHQGNGTAALLRGDASAFTLDLFGARNFPFRKEPCDLGIALPDGTGDDAYLEALAAGLQAAIPRARADLVIYVSGADAYAGDTLGRLALSTAGLEARDRLVMDRCRTAGLPVAVTMAGGYASDVEVTVDIHAATVAAAARAACGAPCGARAG